MADDKEPRRRSTDRPIDDIREDRKAYDDRRRDEYIRRDNVTEESYRRRDRNPFLYWLLALLGLLLLGFLLWWLFVSNQYQNLNITNQNIQNQQGFSAEQKTNNFDQSIPSHQDVVPAAPLAVTVQTNTVNTANSTLTINRDNRDYGTGRVVIEANGNDIRRTMDPNAPEGVYTVNYSSCAEGGSCQNGSYQFKIETGEQSGYQDLSNQRTVSISVNNDKFNPESIIISPNTRVTWTNNNNTEITIGPGIKNIQNFIRGFSSGRLAVGQNVSFTFSEKGYYPIIVFANNQMIIGKVIVR